VETNTDGFLPFQAQPPHVLMKTALAHVQMGILFTMEKKLSVVLNWIPQRLMNHYKLYQDLKHYAHSQLSE
jgi:hypothetical protein